MGMSNNHNFVMVRGEIGHVVDQLKAEYEHLQSTIHYLREENRKLKAGVWQSEEMQRMKALVEDARRGFEITEDEEKRIHEFMDKHLHEHFVYQFTPTALGTSGVIIAFPSKDQFEFQEIG